MRRRGVIASAAGAAAWPLAARAQQGTPRPLRRIGVLSPFSRANSEVWYVALRQGLARFGWIDGETIRLHYRYADGDAARLPALVGELIAARVELIVVAVTPDAQAAASATRTIPIVMAAAGDPVATGLVTNLSHPGGNVTGLSQMILDLAAKRLEMLKQAVPTLQRVGILWKPDEPSSGLAWRDLAEPAQKLGLNLISIEATRAEDLEPALAQAMAANPEALNALPTPLFVDNAALIAQFALRHRLPTMFHLPDFVRLGGLMAYGPDRADLFRRAAGYVDKILKGARPGDLPIEQPVKFELVVNAKTASAIGVRFPMTLLANADEVIE